MHHDNRHTRICRLRDIKCLVPMREWLADPPPLPHDTGHMKRSPRLVDVAPIAKVTTTTIAAPPAPVPSTDEG